MSREGSSSSDLIMEHELITFISSGPLYLQGHLLPLPFPLSPTMGLICLPCLNEYFIGYMSGVSHKRTSSTEHPHSQRGSHRQRA